MDNAGSDVCEQPWNLAPMKLIESARYELVKGI
jgi:hypothetical protein